MTVVAMAANNRVRKSNSCLLKMSNKTPPTRAPNKPPKDRVTKTIIIWAVVASSWSPRSINVGPGMATHNP